jgi:hypothetical protein
MLKGGQNRVSPHFESRVQDPGAAYHVTSRGAGGKPGIERQSLFSLTGWANGLATPFREQDIPKTEISIPGINTSLGADGRAYAVLADGSEDVNITPLASRLYYTFDIAPAKHKLKIIANATALEPDRATTNPRFCVGQRVTFGSAWDETPPNIQVPLTTNKWEFGGTFVNESNQPCATCSLNWTNNPDLQTNETTSAWWTSGEHGFPGAVYLAQLNQGLTFSNGQTAKIIVQGKFNMHRPGLVSYERHIPGATNDNGVLKTFPSGGFYVWVQTAFGGQAGATQLINGYLTNAVVSRNSGGTNELDVHLFLPLSLTDVAAGAGTNCVFVHDEPSIGCSGDTAMHVAFIDYVRFCPGSENPNIFVTLGTASWHIYATAGVSNSVCVLTSEPNGYIDPNITDSQAFPRWTNIWVNPQ